MAPLSPAYTASAKLASQLFENKKYEKAINITSKIIVKDTSINVKNPNYVLCILSVQKRLPFILQTRNVLTSS